MRRAEQFYRSTALYCTRQNFVAAKNSTNKVLYETLLFVQVVFYLFVRHPNVTQPWFYINLHASLITINILIYVFRLRVCV
ncbi:hypothetical protein CANCADRAFT_81037 [Tortispora caseinolytica NRRL Y-17796]|uniref:Uncharacterized protein n=1 Tax=Tortispora caseinolytica NRRL Y-17796 TaxID=767744 RepID=A0A1E4TJS6_9ASCO|nr:hypothetical protein CANCADRAFT_81037 [Tortispora caseinolytica NRRL Y-17796]